MCHGGTTGITLDYWFTAHRFDCSHFTVCSNHRQVIYIHACVHKQYKINISCKLSASETRDQHQPPWPQKYGRICLFLICKQILQKRIKCFATDVWCLKEKLAFKKFLLEQHYPTWGNRWKLASYWKVRSNDITVKVITANMTKAFTNYPVYSLKKQSLQIQKINSTPQWLCNRCFVAPAKSISAVYQSDIRKQFTCSDNG